MRAIERQDAILEYLRESPICDVNTIIDLFDVTPVTIRRDLTYLEKEGKIARTHGGVQLIDNAGILSYNFRIDNRHAEKTAIAKEAEQLVKPGDSVIIDSGTTTAEVGNLLMRRGDVTIITNSIAMIAGAMPARSDSVLVTGGVLDSENQCLIGPDAEASLERVSASFLFLAASGVRGAEGPTSLSPFQRSIKQKMIERAKTRVLCVTNDKFYSADMTLIAGFTDIDILITAHPIKDESVVKDLERQGVRIIIAMPDTAPQ